MHIICSYLSLSLSHMYLIIRSHIGTCTLVLILIFCLSHTHCTFSFFLTHFQSIYSFSNSHSLANRFSFTYFTVTLILSLSYTLCTYSIKTSLPINYLFASLSHSIVSFFLSSLHCTYCVLFSHTNSTYYYLLYLGSSYSPTLSLSHTHP